MTVSIKEKGTGRDEDAVGKGESTDAQKKKDRETRWCGREEMAAISLGKK